MYRFGLTVCPRAGHAMSTASATAVAANRAGVATQRRARSAASEQVAEGAADHGPGGGEDPGGRSMRGENRIETPLYSRRQHPFIQGIARANGTPIGCRATRIRSGLGARTVEANFHRPHRSARAKLALARARARCHGAARG